MRDLTITLSLAVVLVSFCSAQSFENQKMLTTTLHAFTSNSFETDNQIGFGGWVHTVESSSFSIRPQITYGKVNSRNVLFAYGVELEYSSDIVKSSREITTREVGFGASPVLVIQKFIKLSEVFYLTPAMSVMGGYHQSKSSNSRSSNTQSTHQFQSAISVFPVSVTYVVRPRFNLLISLGHMALNFSHKNFTRDPNPSNIKSSNSNLSFAGNITGMRLGFQIVY